MAYLCGIMESIFCTGFDGKDRDDLEYCWRLGIRGSQQLIIILVQYTDGELLALVVVSIGTLLHLRISIVSNMAAHSFRPRYFKIQNR